MICRLYSELGWFRGQRGVISLDLYVGYIGYCRRWIDWEGALEVGGLVKSQFREGLGRFNQQFLSQVLGCVLFEIWVLGLGKVSDRLVLVMGLGSIGGGVGRGQGVCQGVVVEDQGVWAVFGEGVIVFFGMVFRFVQRFGLSTLSFIVFIYFLV